MKKITWLLAILLCLPAGVILARDGGSGGGGERGGGDGGWSGGGNSGGGGGDRGGGSNGGDSSSGTNAGSWDSTDHSSTNHDHAYSNSVRSNGGNFRLGGNSYYRRGNYGSNGYGQVRHFNRSYGSHGSNGYNYSHSTGIHHFNSSTGAFTHSYASGSPKALGRSSLLPHSLQHSAVHMPSTGPSGKAFSASLVSPSRMNSSMVRNQMSSIAHNSAFTARMASFNHSDSLRNHYYWHSWGGRDFCHFYDRFGCNWFGWGWGGSFFWTQWYGDYWWWYDPWNARWCYWWGDGWWWQDPANTTVYIYENGNYVPGDQADANVGVNGYNQPPGGNMAEGSNDENNPDVPKEMVEFPSPDKTRTVKIVGDSGDAFLYDTAKNSFKPLFLESDVKNVQFSKSGKGVLEIKLILSDGSHEIFDAKGKQLKEVDAPKSGQSVDVEGDNT